MESTSPWFTHVVVCYIQSMLNNHVSIAQNYGYHKHVERGSPLPPTILNKPYNEFLKLVADIEGAANNSTALAMFSMPPLFFRSKKRLREEPDQNPSPPKEASLRGWLVFSNPTIELPRDLRPAPCKRLAEECKSCNYGRTCHFKHRIYSRAFNREDQALIYQWVKNTTRS